MNPNRNSYLQMSKQNPNVWKILNYAKKMLVQNHCPEANINQRWQMKLTDTVF